MDGFPGRLTFRQSESAVDLKWNVGGQTFLAVLTFRQAALLLPLTSRLGESLDVADVRQGMIKSLDRLLIPPFRQESQENVTRRLSRDELPPLNRLLEQARIPLAVGQPDFLGGKPGLKTLQLRSVQQWHPPITVDLRNRTLTWNKQRLPIDAEIFPRLAPMLLSTEEESASPADEIEAGGTLLEYARDISRKLQLPGRFVSLSNGSVQFVWSAGEQRRPFVMEVVNGVFSVLPPSETTIMQEPVRRGLQANLDGLRMETSLFDGKSAKHLGPDSFAYFPTLRPAFVNGVAILEPWLDAVRPPYLPHRSDAPQIAFRCLLSHPGQVISNEEFAQWAWGKPYSNVPLKAFWSVIREMEPWLRANQLRMQSIYGSWRSVRTPTFTLSDGTELHGSSFYLTGVNGRDDSPLPTLEHYLLLQAFAQTPEILATDAIWEHVGRHPGPTTIAFLRKTADDLNARLARVGSNAVVPKLFPTSRPRERPSVKKEFEIAGIAGRFAIALEDKGLRLHWAHREKKSSAATAPSEVAVLLALAPDIGEFSSAQELIRRMNNSEWVPPQLAASRLNAGKYRSFREMSVIKLNNALRTIGVPLAVRTRGNASGAEARLVTLTDGSCDAIDGDYLSHTLQFQNESVQCSPETFHVLMQVWRSGNGNSSEMVVDERQLRDMRNVVRQLNLPCRVVGNDQKARLVWTGGAENLPLVFATPGTARVSILPPQTITGRQGPNPLRALQLLLDNVDTELPITAVRQEMASQLTDADIWTRIQRAEERLHVWFSVNDLRLYVSAETLSVFYAPELSFSAGKPLQRHLARAGAPAAVLRNMPRKPPNDTVSQLRIAIRDDALVLTSKSQPRKPPILVDGTHAALLLALQLTPGQYIDRKNDLLPAMSAVMRLHGFPPSMPAVSDAIRLTNAIYKSMNRKFEMLGLAVRISPSKHRNLDDVIVHALRIVELPAFPNTFGVETNPVLRQFAKGGASVETDSDGYLFVGSLLSEKSVGWSELEVVLAKPLRHSARRALLSEAARIFQALDVPLHLSVSSSKVGLWWLTGGQRGPRYELQPSRSLDRILAIIPAHDYLARASAQLVLTQMGKVVTNDDLRNHVWGVRAGTTDPIHKTVDAALTVIEPALHEAHVWIQRQRYQFRSVPTPDLPIEDDVFIDGKTLLLQGPLGGDDSPLSIEQYLMAQTLISAAGSYVWRDRLYAEASGLRCPRTEGYEKSVRDLDRRLALVGATKRLQFEFQEVALRPPFDHAPFDHAAFDRLTSGVSTSFTGRSRYADIWPDFVLHGNIGISGGDRIAPAYQEVLARILRMPVAFQDQFVLLRGMDGGGLSLQRLSDELTKLAFRLELDSCRLADGQVGYRLVFNGRKPMERYLWSPKLRRNCKARRSDMDAITRSHLVEFEEAYSRGSDAIDEDAERSYGYLLGQLRPTVPAAEDAKPSFARSLLETIRSRPLYVASDNNDRVVRERFAKWLTIYGRERHAANVTAQAFLDEAMRRKVLPAPLWRACAAEVDLRQWQLFTEIGIELLRKGRFFSQSQISRFGASDDIRQRYMVGKQFCKAAYEAFPDVCEPIEEPTFALLHDAVMELSSRGEWEAAWSLSDSRVGLPGNA